LFFRVGFSASASFSRSISFSASTCATFLGTGNNIVARGDMSTRVLVCRIDPEMGHPEEREFNYDLLANVAARRAELVVVALTIMRAYVVAGRRRRRSNPMVALRRGVKWSALRSSGSAALTPSRRANK
jgi:hypothetical protein